ncbi:MAG: DUF4350 domain-containing protein [Methanocorpusculum sp.]|nr:DUF4350 domain-containing protein [Methanocorpusculum sp.]
MKKIYIVAAILLIIAAAAVIFQFAGTDSEFSRYNTEWNGTSNFFSGLSHEQYIYDYADLTEKTNSTLLVIAPTENFGGDELFTYLTNGNTIIIFDQSANANYFLESIGSTIRVHNESLRSSDMEYKDSGLFRANVLTDIYGTGVETLFFNYPGYVTGGYTIIETSPLSWVEKRGDNIANKDETLKVYSVGASDNISNGRVTVIADPSMFINSMIDRRHTENMEVITALENQNLIIDQTNSVTTEGGGLFGLLNLMNRFPAVSAVILALLFISAGLVCIRRYYKNE